MAPNYESLGDSFMADSVALLNELCVECNLTYEVLINRAQDIRTQIDPGYREEMDGFSSKLSGDDVNVLRDGKLSRDEYLILNLYSLNRLLAVFSASCIISQRTAVRLCTMRKFGDLHHVSLPIFRVCSVWCGLGGWDPAPGTPGEDTLCW
jgi:hypothetical protein